MSQTTTEHIGQTHNDWLRSLKSYKEELLRLKDKLTEIGGKTKVPEVAVEVERYENRLRVQQENIKRLRHTISSNIETLDAQTPSNHPDDRYLQLGNEFSAEEQAVNELRNDFSRFSSEWT